MPHDHFHHDHLSPSGHPYRADNDTALSYWQIMEIAVREPRSILAEFGVTLPDTTTVRVHDSTADMRYIVISMRPEGTEKMSQSDLETLITRDA